MKIHPFPTPTFLQRPMKRLPASPFDRPMKHGAWLLLGCCLMVVSSHAQYSITWSTIDGGGGTSSGGAYRVRGTIGQPDAGPTMSNGPYAVTGGFWVLAVQVEGAPRLTIVPAGPGHVTLSWTPAMPGFVLQESNNLDGGWTNSASGATNPITVPIVPPRRFYRLIKP